MGLKSGRRGRRSRVIALICASVLAAILVAAPLASGLPALARPALANPAPRASAVPRPDPLAHASAFRRAAGQSALAAPAGVAVDPRRRRPDRPAGTPHAPASARPELTRRRLLTGATALSGVAAGAAVLPVSLRRALAAALQAPPGGSLRDIEHIVILMQENRSFDHYFGTMPGVRGFADPAAIRLPGGAPVFRQPFPGHAQGYLAPFHLDTRTTSAQATPGTDHSWPTQHLAWNNGAMDRWVQAKGPFTMGYFTQADIPFQWALARAFTVCDHYFCSVLGPTNPNRLCMWTGMIDPDGTGGGPVTDNSPAYNNVTLSWTTYPERLQRAGVSWQVYQEEDNYDDNALAWFRQFAGAPVSSPLWQRGMQKRPAGWFEADARAGRLPQVSWLAAPTAQSEHPDYFPAAGAEYVASKLDAIASNEDLWHKTVFILTYDENDGLFDHVPPPVAPRGTRGEYVGGEPVGPGFRVPAVVVSPWSAGGRVCPDVLDHTSLIRLIERRFGVREPNISAFRRRTCGDFTTALRFSGPPAAYPRSPGPRVVDVNATAERTPGVARVSASAAAGRPGPALVRASWPVSPACRCWLVVWSMVVVLKNSVQLRAMVSTSGVLADEKRRAEVPRFAEARNPPTGENAASGGASSRAATYGTIGPRKAAATTRKIAFSSDVAAAVSGAVVVAETAKSGIAAASATSPPMTRPGPSSRGSAAASVSASVGGTRAARRPAASTASSAAATPAQTAATAGSQS